MLATSFVVSAALGEDDVELVANAVFEAAEVYALALRDGVEAHLGGRPVQPALRPFA